MTEPHKFALLLQQLTLFVLALLLSFPLALAADLSHLEENQSISLSQQRQYLTKTTLAGVGAVTLWGIWQWDYFSNSPGSQSEGWFEADTKEGGLDKLGHMYSTYTLSHGLMALYRSFGINRDDSAIYGALTSFCIMGYMELGDSFSSYGFSYEDMIANGVGALYGYLIATNPNLADYLDFRWEYGFKPNQSDIFTDYENTKYLFSFKLSGFDPGRQNWWRFLELHAGYYARGYDSVNAHDQERNLYFGIGINLSEVFFSKGWNKTGTAFRYLQMPYTYLAGEIQFD